MRPWLASVLALALVFAVAPLPQPMPTAAAAPKRPHKRFYFEMAAATTKAKLDPAIEELVLPLLNAEVKKQLGAHPQFVSELSGAPDRDKDGSQFRRFLTKRGIAGAYAVSVEVTAASEALEELDGRGQRLIVRLSVHLFGETIPGKTMGFTGDGSASIRQEVGKKVRPRDREFTWQSAVEHAVSDAISTAVESLSKPAKK